MFSTYLRAGITLLLAAPLLWLHQFIAEPLVAELETMARPDSPLIDWLLTFVEWFALIVLLSLVIWVVAAAVEQRQTVGGGF